MQTTRAWILAVLLACIFSFAGLGNHPLRAADEPRVAGIAWEMQHSGQIVPHLGGVPFLEHPPLFYVLLGACIDQFGASEGVARLPGAIASALTLLIVFFLGLRLASPAAGLYSLLALVGIAGFFRYSHRAVVDPLLMLFVMAGYAAYVCAVWRPATPGRELEPDSRVSPGSLVAVYLFAALAFWVKGPIGVVAVGGPLAIDVLAGRRWRVLRSPAHLLGLPLLGAACAAWPLLLQHELGSEGMRTFLFQNGLYRVFPEAGPYAGGHEEPFWYYFHRAPIKLGWTMVFIPATALWLIRGKTPAGWQLPALRFLAWVLPVGTLLLSLPGTKRVLYLLPFMPPLAVAVGAWIAAVGTSDPGRTRVEAAIASLCARLSELLLRPFASFAIPKHELHDDIARAEAGACQGPRRAATIGYALSVVAFLVIIPFTNAGRDMGPVAREVGERVGDEPLAGYSLDEGMRGALSFYAGRQAETFYTPDGLAGKLEQRGLRYVFSPLGFHAELQRELGTEPVRIWDEDERTYALYVFDPAARAASHRSAEPDAKADVTSADGR